LNPHFFDAGVIYDEFSKETNKASRFLRVSDLGVKGSPQRMNKALIISGFA